MPQTLVTESARLVEGPEDPREVAGEWTRELARLTEEKGWAMSQLGRQPENNQDLARRLTLINRQIASVTARINWLADHS